MISGMRRWSMKLGIASLVVILGAVFASEEGMASGSAGIELGLDSARALGKGNAVAADPRDASTIAFNPAGMTEIEKNSVALGTTIIVPDLDYDSADGSSESASQQEAYIPAFFAAVNTPIEGLKIGGGVHAPFGLQTRYESQGHFKYTGIDNFILSTNYTLVGAYKLTPWLSVGGGFTYADVDVRQVGKLNSSFISTSAGLPAVLPDADIEHDFEGHGYGWNLSFLLVPDEKLKIGFFFRSQVQASLRGEVDVDNISGFIPTLLFGGSSFHTSADTDITFPPSAFIGVSYQVNDRLDVELDFGVTHWSVFDQFNVAYGTSNAVLAAANPSKHGFQDTISLNLGAAYKLNDQLDLLLGYAYFERAAKKSDYSNVFPDGDRHNLTVGLDYHFGNYSLAVAYAGQFVNEVTVDNDVGSLNGVSVDGDYSGFYHVFTTSLTAEF